MRKKSWPLAVMLGLIVCTPLMAAEELRLWPGKAPGSEDWSEPEEIITSASGSRSIINVSDPTMTVHLPDASKANGTACSRSTTARKPRAG
jgi:hypothetical protein